MAWIQIVSTINARGNMGDLLAKQESRPAYCNGTSKARYLGNYLSPWCRANREKVVD